LTFGDCPAQRPTLASALVQRKVEVIVAIGAPAVLAAADEVLQ
jgi:hypothetical protein